VERMPDGRRVVTAVTELQGMEGDIILLQDIFKHRMVPSSRRGQPQGELVPTGLRPKFLDKLIEAGVELPAKVFKSPPPVPAAAPNGGRGRGADARSPEEAEAR
jgi:hypothetical protein